jgi:hypothetical protein
MNWSMLPLMEKEDKKKGKDRTNDSVARGQVHLPVKKSNKSSGP